MMFHYAQKDDYTLERYVMGNTFIVVCSLPVNPQEDCVRVEKGGREK